MYTRTAVIACLTLLACGEDGGRAAAKESEFYATSCDVLPEDRYQPAPSGGIPGSWIVVFVNGSPVRATAEALATKYDAKVTSYFEHLGGAALSISDSMAVLVSQEAAVCYVAQNAVVVGP